MSTFHIHYTFAENSGEVRRIKNINKDLAQKLSNEVYEISFISIGHFIKRKEHSFKLHSNIKKKYYFPTLPFTYRSHIFKRLNTVWCSFIVLILWMIHKPQFAISEFSIGWQSLRFLPSSVKCIIDVHGATREEYEYNWGEKTDKGMADTYDYIEMRGMKKASYIVCQSEAMKKYLVKKYNFLDKNKIFPYKCGADRKIFFYDAATREEMRKQFNIEKDDFVFIYSGGLHKWQKIETAISLFAEYSKTHKAKFIILTLEKEGAKQLISQFDAETQSKFIITSAQNKDVYKYLNAADAAFLIRENVVLNQVASPTKLAEYMFCGLPIITNDTANSWIDNNSLIFNLDKQNIDQIEDFVKQTDKKAIIDYALENLSLECDEKNLTQLATDAKQ